MVLEDKMPFQLVIPIDLVLVFCRDMSLLEHCAGALATPALKKVNLEV